MRARTSILLLPPIVCVAAMAHALQVLPPKAAAYHASLLKSPHNKTLFERFYNAWIDTEPLEDLGALLVQRAHDHGGAHLALLAHYQIRRGFDAEALETLGKAMSARPQDAQLRIERARLLLRRNDHAAARQDLEAVLAAKDSTLLAEAAKLIGRSHLREGNPAAAIEAWSRLIEGQPGNPEILEDLIELAAAAAQMEQALAWSEQLIKLSSDPYKKTVRRIRHAALLADFDRTDEAIALWADTLRQTGENSWLEREIIAHISEVYRRQDRIDALTGQLGELARAHPRRLAIHRQLAKLEIAQGQADSAIGRYREVLRRSPGQAELRQEFIRLLMDAERYSDAASELENMIKASPGDAELQLWMAEIRHFEHGLGQLKDEGAAAILAPLQQAHRLLGSDEAPGLRIAALMLRYGLRDQGEALLTDLVGREGASSTPAETLAAEYARTRRKPQALALLTRISQADQPQTVIRATDSMTTLGHPDKALAVLSSRAGDFAQNSEFLAALARTSLAAQQPQAGVEAAIQRLRQTTNPLEIREAADAARRVIVAANLSDPFISDLHAKPTRSDAETCLLASLLEENGLHDQVDTLLAEIATPGMIRFHAELLSLRGDFDKAIRVLTRLSGTAAGESPSYFQTLTELQQGAGRSEAALKTIGQWKIAAPTAKTPWITAAAMLQSNGRMEEALDALRRASIRFSEDEDIAASLAQLHQQLGQTLEAERIYWKLYDRAGKADAQRRWAQCLSDLASRHGRIAELRERLLERSRSNSRSLGPVLSLITLAQISNDDKALREHLNRALLLQPGHSELRIQLAELEKRRGDPQQQIRVLKDGVAKDPSGVIRTALAHAYIEQGEVSRGVHMLNSLSPEQTSDPRNAEASALTLAQAGLLPEAIEYLQATLPAGGDWHSRILLAQLLQDDGRELQALPHWIALLKASKPIAGLLQNNPQHNPSYNPWSGSHTYFQGYPSQVPRPILHSAHHGQTAAPRPPQADAEIALLYSLAGRSNQFHSSARYRQTLPTTPEQARALALIQIALLQRLEHPPIDALIEAARIDRLELVNDMIPAQPGQRVEFATVFKKHPTEPGMLANLTRYGILRQNDPELLQRVQEALKSAHVDAQTRLAVTTQLLYQQPESEPLWQNLLSCAEQLLKGDEALASHTFTAIYALLSSTSPKVPDGYRPRIKRMLHEYAISGQLPADQRHQIKILQLAITGTPEAWIRAVNDGLREPCRNPATRSNPTPNRSAYNSPTCIPPQIYALPLSSIEMDLALHAHRSLRHAMNCGAEFSIEQLLGELHQLDSPILAQLLAIEFGEPQEITPPNSLEATAEQSLDHQILAIYRAWKGQQKVASCRLLHQLLETKDLSPEVTFWARNSLVGISLQLAQQARAEFSPPLRDALKALSTTATAYYLQQLGAHAKTLGFDDLQPMGTAIQQHHLGVTSIRPRPHLPSRHLKPLNHAQPVVIETPRPTVSRSRQSNPTDRSKQFARQGKHEAAARELIQMIRKASANGSSINSSINNLRSTMSAQTREALIAHADPGAAPSLTRQLEYIDICEALDEKAKALTALQALARQRPFDPQVTTRLAFALPATQVDTAVELLKSVSHSPQAARIANDAHQTTRNSRDADRIIDHHQLIARLLEELDPDDHDNQLVGRVTSQANTYYHYRLADGLTPLLQKSDSDNKEHPAAGRYRETGRRLAQAMTRHASTAEAGFKYIKLCNWVDDGSLDELARQCLLLQLERLTRLTRNDSGNRNLQLPGGNHDSPLEWLLTRLKSGAEDGIMTPEFLAALKRHDERLPLLLKALSADAGIRDLEALIDAGAANSRSYDCASNPLLNEAAFRAADIGGAHKLLCARIRALAKDWTPDPADSSSKPHYFLYRAAIVACANLDAAAVEETCAVILESVQLEFKGERHQIISQSCNLLSTVFQQLPVTPATYVHMIGAFHRLGLPVNFHYHLSQSIKSLRVEDADEAIGILQSMGLLAKAEDWQPLLGGKIIQINPKESRISSVNLTREVCENFDYKIKRELAARLAKRTPRTFGSLITAAAMSQSAEARDLTIEAFRLAAPALAKMPEERLKDFEVLIGNASSTPLSMIPPQLHDAVKRKRAEDIAALEEQVEKSLASALRSGGSSDPFSQTGTQIRNIALLDPDKAAAIFLKVDAAYEQNIAHFQTRYPNPQRDYFHSSLNAMLSSSNPDCDGAIRFHLAVRGEERGARFGISGRQSNTYLQSIGRALHQSLIKKNGSALQSELAVWQAVSQLPEEIRQTAIAALTCYALLNTPGWKHEDALEKYGKDPQVVDPALKRLAILCSALRGWNADDPQGRAKTVEAFAALLQNHRFDATQRLQIAVSAIQSQAAILQHPVIAKPVADLIVDCCSQGRSVVQPWMLQMLIQIGRLDDPSESLAHLQVIHSAFWRNANSPQDGGHAPISYRQVEPLFHTAIRLQDQATSERLFAILKPLLSGKLDSIIELISAEQFNLAARILPGPGGDYSRNRNIRFSDGFERKMEAFRNCGLDPESLFRFECELLKEWTRNRHLAGSKFIGESKPRLLRSYLDKPPENEHLRMEALLVFSHSQIPCDETIAELILKTAAAMDTAEVMKQYHGQSRSGSAATGESRTRFELALLAAMIELHQGNPQRLVTICDAITHQLQLDADHNESYSLPSTMQFTQTLVPWVSLCVADGNTAGFTQVVDPLCRLAIASSASRSQSRLRELLATCELLAHWESRPQAFTAMFDQLDAKAASIKKGYRSSSHTIPFLYALYRLPTSISDGGRLGPKSEAFLRAFLSRESLSGMIPTDPEWLRYAQYGDLRMTIDKFCKSPPETFSLKARVTLKYRFLKGADELETLDQAKQLLADIPQGEDWNFMRIEIKIRVVRGMLLNKESTADIRKLFDSIPADGIPFSLTSIHQAAASRLKMAEKASTPSPK